MILRTASLLVVVVGALSGCAASSRTEYRAGLVLHSRPDYVFQIPDGWRRASPEDYLRFGHSQRVLQRLDENGKRRFVDNGRKEIARSDVVLISDRGAFIHVGHGSNRGGRHHPAGYVLNESEKAAIWRLLEDSIQIAAPANDKPGLRFVNADLVEFGPNVVLRVRYVAESQRGTLHWTMCQFVQGRDSVTMLHVGIPDDKDEGIVGFEAIARSFRFD